LVFLEDYDINLARHLVQGVDVWLNTPRRPKEASGTSGQKAALNGAINFSVLDGWW
jgi:starch phosphorylase